ncbi:FAD-NAD(P)-binding-domain-containing protein [Nemania serpens]|nr:FAD-NAD(P)-binding-domain-containing protein [Nemania serpens]
MSPDLIRIAIGGGGACCLAILLCLVEQAGRGYPIQSIHVFEKNSDVGPGLAYTKNARNAIINMRADTMGLKASDSLHFSRWVKSHCPQYAGQQYPPRHLYGDYLVSVFDMVVSKAAVQGITLDVIHQELVEALPADGKFHLLGDQGRRLTVDRVVLALGNFAAGSQHHLSDSPGYIDNPWRFEDLDRIPSKSPVGIVGSRLSGIDAAFRLMENGHEGSIYLLSRGGRLPKVQGREHARPYGNHHGLYVLARDLERLGPAPENYLTLLHSFRLFADQLGIKDWSDFLREKDPLEELSHDIAASEKGLVHWRSLADSTAPMLERLWNSLTPEHQTDFMTDWGSIWYTYVHAVPLENAQRLQKLLAKDQLRISKFSEIIRSTGGFTITLPTHDIYTEYIVEASGLEGNASDIKSPLIRSLLSSRVLEEHHAGGFSVNQRTLESTTTRGLYVIGSLTTGVHFYTNGIDCNVRHAAQIARHLVGKPVHPPAHVALILAAESTRLWSGLLHDVAQKMLTRHLIPFIYPAASGMLESDTASDMTLNALREQFGILVHSYQMLDASFLTVLQRHHIDMCLLHSGEIALDLNVSSLYELRRNLIAPPLQLWTKRLAESDEGRPDGTHRHTLRDKLEYYEGEVFDIARSVFGQAS